MKSLSCDGCGKHTYYDQAGIPKDWFRIKVDFFERSEAIRQLTKLDLCRECGLKAQTLSYEEITKRFRDIFNAG